MDKNQKNVSMCASRFLLRYERLRKNIEEEERLLSLFDRNPTTSPAQTKGFSEAHCALLGYLAPTRAQISARLFFHYRLYEKLTMTLSAAIRRIDQKCLRDYLIWHYFYQFTHEAIAEVLNYSVRQVYRQGAQARCALNKVLRLPPHAKRTKFCRYTLKQKPLYQKILKPAYETLLAS